MGTERISWTSGAPTTEFILEADRVGQDADDNYTLVRVQLVAINRGSTGSYSSYSGRHRASIDGVWAGASYTAEPFLPSGYADGATRWRKSWDVKVPHGSDGSRGAVTLRMEVEYGGGAVDIVRTASFNDFPDLKTVPPAPTITKVDAITATTMNVTGSSNGNGGSAILEWQIRYDESSTAASPLYKTHVNPTTLTGLARNTTYYLWMRGRNALGWGPWSARVSAKTLAESPDPPTGVNISEVGTTSLRYKFTPADNGGSAFLEHQIGYGKDPNTPQTFIASSGNTLIENLEVGNEYHFWSRSRTAMGWSPWSAKLTQRMLGGVRIKVGGVQKYAIPYVKVNGVWKMAIPYVKASGVYKRTG